MEKVLIEGYEFIKIDLSGAEAVFSTAKNGLNFNKGTQEGRENVENIKKWFGVKEVGFLDQIHSDYVFIYEGKKEEGDALITNLNDTAVGVFTADCVPILLYDKSKNIIAAVHSGWKGTFSCILSKTIEDMNKKYGTKGEDLIAFIGPHMHQCCYEVGEELIEKFKQSDVYGKLDIFNGRNLSMTKCIIHQLKTEGVIDENIHELNICTFCNNEYELHSHRKNKDGGRLFSFIFLK